MGEFKQDIPAEKLLEMYSGMIYRLAYLRTRNQTDAEDITQDVFLKYISANKKFNDEEHRKAWLLRVTMNCTNSLVTSAYYRHRTSLEEIPEEIIEIEEKSELYYAVQSLPEKYRITIHLFYYEDLSIAEISAVTKTKESTVKSHLLRAREMLRNILKEEQNEL